MSRNRRAGSERTGEDYLGCVAEQDMGGKTENIPKQVVPHQNRSVGELLCAVNNDKLELLPNINVNVRINSRERIGVLSVPRGAVAAEAEGDTCLWCGRTSWASENRRWRSGRFT